MGKLFDFEDQTLILEIINSILASYILKDK